MATRHFEKSQAAAFPGSLSSKVFLSGYAAPLRLAHVYDAGALRQNPEWHQQAVVDLHALGRGVRWAFAIEGGAALLIYAIWSLWRLLI
jgi:hypothetical protein